MAARHRSPLLEGELVRAFDVSCTAPRSRFGEDEVASAAQIVLPRRGVFLVKRNGGITAVDTNTVIILGREDPYRVSHPVDGGDEATVFVYSHETLMTALGSDGGWEAALRPADQLLLFRVRRALSDESTTQLEREECCMLLLRRLAPVLLPRRQGEALLGPGQRLRVQHVRALLASEPTRSWDLATVAGAAGTSPFHLARQFRCLTGETIGRYLLRLRLALAIERIAEGEDDLMQLASELGFAHHSHFSARFRAVFGTTPSHVRGMLTRRQRGVARS